MKCIKCKRDLPENAVYCCYCGKKQTVIKRKTHKRAQGTGTITKDNRNQKQWKAYAPQSKYGRKRVYIGAFMTRAEAQKALDEYISSGNPELFNIDLEGIYNLWSESHYKQVSDNTVASYTAMWKHFDSIRNYPMKEIKTVHIQQIINETKSNAAAKMLRSMAIQLFDFAMKNDIVSKNYAEFTVMPKFEKKEKRTFTKDEISVLWEHTDDLIIQIILFMIYTGLRIGEMTGLLVGNVHIDEGYIIAGEKTKAGKDRFIPLPSSIPELTEFLSGWIDTAVKNSRTTVLPFSSQQFRNLFYKALDKYGISDLALTPHSTRHTFASLSASAGIKAENLQRIIGHASYTTTADIYIHKDNGELKKEMQKLKK